MSDYADFDGGDDGGGDDVETEEAEVEEEEVVEEGDEGSNLKDEVTEFQEKLMTKAKVYEKLYHQQYRTTNRLTKFERAAILGIRAEMIADGALHLDTGDIIDPRKIAAAELDANLIPMLIERPLPGGKKGDTEIRRVADLHK